MVDNSKQPQSWFRQKVLECIERTEIAEAKVKKLEERLEQYERIEQLVDHPLVLEYASFWERFRKTEQTLDSITTRMNYNNKKVDDMERTILRLSNPTRRGPLV